MTVSFEKAEEAAAVEEAVETFEMTLRPYE
jgi:hypothetical protein